MGNNILKGINTRLFIIPFIILLVLYLCIGVAAYYFNYPYPAKDFYRLQMVSVLKEKNAAINILLDHYRKALSFIADNENIRDDVKTIINSTNPASKKLADAKERLSNFINEMLLMTDQRMFALISLSGIVLHSNREDAIGEDWSEREFFRKVDGLQKTEFTGFTENKDIESGMVFLSPVIDKSGQLNAVLYFVISVDKLSELLDGFYRMDNFYIVDEGNRILFTRHGIFSEESKLLDINSDRFYYHFDEIKNTPYRLAVVVDREVVEDPLNAAIPIYLSYLFFIFAVVMFQKISAKRLIINPLRKLTNAMELVANGNTKPDIGGRFISELSDLKDAFEGVMKRINKISVIVNISDMISEIENYAKGLVSENVEVVVEIDNTIKEMSVHSGLLIKQILTSLMNNAIRSTDSGTITLLSSLINTENIKYLEFFIADTGHGIDGMGEFASQLSDDILKEISVKSSSLTSSNITIAKTLSESLGGRIYIENIPRKGVVIKVLIPF